MAVKPPEFTRLFSGEILPKEERRGLVTTLVAKLLMMAAVAALISTSFMMRSGFSRDRVVIACAIAVLTSHVVIVFGRAHHRIRGLILVFGIFLAGYVAENDPCAIFFGRSSLFLAVPAVIAAVTLRPHCTLLYWAGVQVAALATAILAPHEFSTFSTMSLLVVCVVMWLSTARADRVADILAEEKRLAEEARDEAETAIGIIVTAEETRLEHPLWPTRTAKEEMAERSRT